MTAKSLLAQVKLHLGVLDFLFSFLRLDYAGAGRRFLS